jgi:uncharacterized membrane protein
MKLKHPILSKENFEKLPQLDRIEFRQREDRVGRGYTSAVGVAMITFYICFFVMCAGICALWVLTHSTPLMLFMVNYFIWVLRIWIIVFVFAIIVDLYFAKKQRKLYDELALEYLHKAYMEVKKSGRPKKQKNGI